MYCPRCGTNSPQGAIICADVDCGWLLSNPNVPRQHRIDPDASRDTLSDKPYEQSLSPQSDSETLPKPHRLTGFLERVGRRRGSAPIGLMASWIVVTVAVAGGIAYGMHLNAAPRVVYRYHYAKSSPSPSHHHPTAPRSSAHASTSPATAPSIQTKTSPAPNDILTVNPVFHGTLVNGRLIGTVYVQVAPGGQRFKASVQIDTGAERTMVNSAFMQTWGGIRASGTVQVSGIGGTETVPLWQNVSLFPAANTTYPMLHNATVEGGLGRTIIGETGIDVLLGQDVLSQGTLVQKGSTWTFTYTGGQ